MNIGYIKSNYMINNSNEYKRKLQKLNISKLYIDKQGESINLRELLKYVRQGDNIIVEDIQHLSKSIGEFTELALNLRHQGVNIICKRQQIDTSSLLWDEISKQLSVFIADPSEQQTGRTPRNIEDLDKCFDLVAEGKLTVEEACKQLNIGKSTYYRRWRKVIKINQQPQEKHPERFKEFGSLVATGQITVTEAARQMNIGITTYYRMRKAQKEQITRKSKPIQ